VFSFSFNDLINIIMFVDNGHKYEHPPKILGTRLQGLTPFDGLHSRNGLALTRPG
jgi:hypothetical protein